MPLASRKTPDDRARIIHYVENYFEARSRTEWPTVRQAAKALKIRQSTVEEEANDGLCLSCHRVDWKVPLGDYYVELIEDPEAVRG